MEEILVKTTYLCLSELGWKRSNLGSESTDVVTDLYRHKLRLAKNRHEFNLVKIRLHLKWYATVVLD